MKPFSGAQARSQVRFAITARTFIALLLAVLMLAIGASDSLTQVVGAPFDSARLERLRGLTFKKPVSVVVLRPAQVQHIIEPDLKREYSDERLRAEGIAGSMLGLYAPHFDLKAAILKRAYTPRAALYSDDLKEIVVVNYGADRYSTFDMRWLVTSSGPLATPLRMKSPMRSKTSTSIWRAGIES